MSIKKLLENLQYTDVEIRSYETIKLQTIELYRSINYTSDSLKRMVSYVDNQIAKEKMYYTYWLNIIKKLEDDRYRDILKLRYIEDYTIKEIAEKLSYNPRTVSRLINQAIKAVSKAHSKAYKRQFSK